MLAAQCLDQGPAHSGAEPGLEGFPEQPAVGGVPEGSARRAAPTAGSCLSAKLAAQLRSPWRSPSSRAARAAPGTGTGQVQVGLRVLNAASSPALCPAASLHVQWAKRVQQGLRHQHQAVAVHSKLVKRMAPV